MIKKQKDSSPNNVKWRPKINSLPKFHLIALVLVLGGMIAGGYFILSSFASEQVTYNPKADPALQVQNLTKVSRTRAKRYREARQAHPSSTLREKSEAVEVIKERKKAMLALMASKPQEARKYAADDELKSAIPYEAKSDVESLAKVNGKWLTTIVDSLEHKSASKQAYRLVEANGRQNDVLVAKKPETVKDGAEIEVRGVQLDSVIATTPEEITGAAITTGGGLTDVIVSNGQTSPYIPTAIGAKKVAVYLVNFQNDKSVPKVKEKGADVSVNSAFVTRYLTTNSDSVAKLYAEQSYGKMSFDFKVYDWKTVPYDNVAGSDCRSLLQSTPENSALEQNGNAVGSSAYNSYDIHMFIFNNVVPATNSSCDPNVSGFGSYPINSASNRPRSDIFMNKIYTSEWFETTLAHELGHNLGLAHAMSKFGDDTHAGGPYEYGDPYDVMGKGIVGESAHFNAFHKWQLGWLSDANIAMASNITPPLYSLESKPTSSSEVKAIKVKNGNDWPTLTDTYMEYRSSFSSVTDKFTKFSAGATGVPMPGVIFYGTFTLAGRPTTMLLDPLTEYNNSEDSLRAPKKLALLSGEQIMRKIAPASPWTAKVTNVFGNSALLDIQIANDSKVPLAPMSVVAKGGDRSVNLIWQNSTNLANFDLRNIRLKLKGLKDYSGYECYVLSFFDYGRVANNLLIDGTSGKLEFYTNNTHYQSNINPSNCSPSNAYAAGVSPFVNGQPYTITLQSEDLFDNKSAEVSVTFTPQAGVIISKPTFDDGQKLTKAPVDLRVMPRVNVSTAGVQLAWDASPSAGVMNYKVYRNGALISTLLGSPVVSYYDSGAKLGGQSYTVRAVDNRGVESLDSNAVYASCGWLFLWTCK